MSGHHPKLGAQPLLPLAVLVAEADVSETDPVNGTGYANTFCKCERLSVGDDQTLALKELCTRSDFIFHD